MKLELELELTDVYGGDGEIRYEPKEKATTQRTRTVTTVRQSIGVPITDSTKRESKEARLEPINTFRFTDGKPMLRLGGPHGKLWGSLKGCAKQFYDLGDPDFAKSYKAIIDMIQVTPVWVPLAVDGEVRVDGIPQILKGGAGMVIQYYDVLPTARCKTTLTFPDVVTPKVRKLLAHLQVAPHLNKRRSMIRVTKES